MTQCLQDAAKNMLKGKCIDLNENIFKRNADNQKIYISISRN
jgi:hypothetical protein